MIVVDTSVWVAALRDGEGAEAARLTELLDDDQVLLPIIVRLEILSGSSAADHAVLSRLLSALPVLYPGDSTWARIESWVGEARATGRRFGIADLLVGALAAEWEAAVWSLDADFRAMADLGFVDTP
ncbi:MAG: PIN domain-containing protein [Actinomycetota bacterium]